MERSVIVPGLRNGPESGPPVSIRTSPACSRRKAAGTRSAAAERTASSGQSPRPFSGSPDGWSGNVCPCAFPNPAPAGRRPGNGPSACPGRNSRNGTDTGLWQYGSYGLSHGGIRCPSEAAGPGWTPWCSGYRAGHNVAAEGMDGKGPPGPLPRASDPHPVPARTQNP